MSVTGAAGVLGAALFLRADVAWVSWVLLVSHVPVYPWMPLLSWVLLVSQVTLLPWVPLLPRVSLVRLEPRVTLLS